MFDEFFAASDTSHPSWVRGLKRVYRQFLGLGIRRTSQEVRGLKLKPLHGIVLFRARRTFHGCVDEISRTSDNVKLS